MSIVPFSPSTRVILAAIVLITLVGVAISVGNPLLALEMERWGTSSTLAGLTATCAGLGTVLAVPLVPMLGRRFGVAPLLAAALVISALASALLPFLPGIGHWSLLRFVLGAGIGVAFTLSEYWINAAAEPSRRGLVMGVYATTLYLGFAAGPPIIVVIGTTGLLPYLAVAAIILAGLVPLALAGPASPGLDNPASGSVLRFVQAAPIATLAALMFGAIETGTIIQLAVHNVRIGFGEAEAAMLLSAFTLGNVLFQIPVGMISDRIDRSRLLLALALASAGLPLFLPFAGLAFWSHAALLFLIGGISGGLYPVGLAMLGGRFSGTDLAAANAAFVLLYSLGLMVGPPLVGLGMDLSRNFGLPGVISTLFALYALFVASRIRVGRP